MVTCGKRRDKFGQPCPFVIQHDGECEWHTVPCAMCGDPTRMTGTKRCDACWEAERQIDRIATVLKLREAMQRAIRVRVLGED